MKTEIIPALMPKSYADLYEKVARVRDLVKTIQIDVMDGHFVPPLGWPLQEQEEDHEEFRKLVSGELLLPFGKEVVYEADLMILRPEESIKDWVGAGFARIILHIESGKKISEIINEWKGIVEIGIAASALTANEDLYPLVEKADFIQLMGIEKIGYQGEPFDERVLHTISALRKKYPEAIISVDGGVNEMTAEKIAAASANRLCIGSAIWASANPAEAVRRFQKLF